MPTPQTTAQTDQTPLVELTPPVSTDAPGRRQSPSRRRKVRAVRKLLVRQHTRGHFFVREQGKDIYLSTNFNEAQQKAVTLLGAHRIEVRHSPNGGRSRSGGSFTKKFERDMRKWRKENPVVVVKSKTFTDAANELFESVEAERGHEASRHYRKTLAPFLAAFGKQTAELIHPTELNRFRTELARKYAPKSVNHRLAATRRLLRFCYDMDFVPQPFRLNVLKAVAQPPTPNKALSAQRVKNLIADVAGVNLNLAKMLLLQFWTCMRPSEVSKVVFGLGEFEERYSGIFKLNRGKTDLQTGEPTRIVFTPQAMALLKTIEPEYAQHRYYCRACHKVAQKLRDEFSPGPLRHTAATILIDAGIDGEVVETCLHHIPHRVQRTYRPPPYQKAKEALKLLAELVPLSVLKGR
ncbi:MAG: tyrosine-type recombinase/integrase [Phycisphaerales bacterium]